MTNEYAIFATRFNVPASAAYVLPALFEKAAASQGMATRALLNTATFNNRELGEYLAGVAKRIAD